MLFRSFEELWPIPWPAIPLRDDAEEYFGQRYPLKLCPSLSVATAVRRRSLPAERHVRTWISRDVCEDFWPRKGEGMCHSTEEIIDALTKGTSDQDVVVIAHGVPAEGITHALTLVPKNKKFPPVPFTPFEAMIGTPPGRC